MQANQAQHPYHRYEQLLDFLDTLEQRLVGPLTLAHIIGLFAGLFGGFFLSLVLARWLAPLLGPLAGFLLPVGGAVGGIALTWRVQGDRLYTRWGRRLAYLLRRYTPFGSCAVDSADFYAAPPPALLPLAVPLDDRPAVTYGGRRSAAPPPPLPAPALAPVRPLDALVGRNGVQEDPPHADR